MLGVTVSVVTIPVSEAIDGSVSNIKAKLSNGSTVEHKHTI